MHLSKNYIHIYVIQIHIWSQLYIKHIYSQFIFHKWDSHQKNGSAFCFFHIFWRPFVSVPIATVLLYIFILVFLYYKQCYEEHSCIQGYSCIRRQMLQISRRTAAKGCRLLKKYTHPLFFSTAQYSSVDEMICVHIYTCLDIRVYTDTYIPLQTQSSK